jgi:hypothetical protein
MVRIVFILLFFSNCARGDYPELRRLFKHTGQLFQDYRKELIDTDTPDKATRIMQAYYIRIEDILSQKEEILKKYPELREIRNLRTTCDRFEEFHAFREDFTQFYRDGDLVAKKFGHDKVFRAESTRGRKLILRML